jgi:hypothetical protein
MAGKQAEVRQTQDGVTAAADVDKTGSDGP